MKWRRTLSVKGESLRSTLDALEARFPFKESQEVVRVAIAYAIRRGLGPDEHEAPAGKDSGTWNTGSIDPDGSLRDVVTALYPEEADPYECMNALMNRGLSALTLELEAGRLHSVSDLLRPAGSPDKR